MCKMNLPIAHVHDVIYNNFIQGNTCDFVYHRHAMGFVND